MATHPPPPGKNSVQPHTVVMATQPVPMTGVTFHESPVRLTCSFCHADVVTAISREVGTLTWVACFVIILVGLFIPFVWLGCCLIPFCVPACKDVNHICPNCQQIVGRYRRM